MAPEWAVVAVLLLAAGLGRAQQAMEAGAVHWTPVADSEELKRQNMPQPIAQQVQQQRQLQPPGEDIPVRPSLEGVTRPDDIALIASTESDVGGEYQSRTVPPTIQQLAETVQTDAQLQERIRQEQRDRGTVENPIEFPPEPILSRDRYLGRNWPQLKMEVAPYYLAHGRLLFQQINSERYGWDLGFIQPVIAAAEFYWDFVTLPYNLGKSLCRPYEANLGWCLPGDPVPLAIYPPEISLTGTITETATILALVAIFP